MNIYSKALVVLVVGTAEDWSSIGRYALKNVCTTAAFIKVTRVVLADASDSNSYSDNNSDSCERSTPTSTLPVRVAGSSKETVKWQLRAVREVTAQCEQALGVQNVVFSCQHRAVALPNYVDKEACQELSKLQVWELSASNFLSTGSNVLHMNVYQNGDVLDERLIGKYDRCWLKTTAPSMLLPQLKLLIRPGGWLIVSVEEITTVSNSTSMQDLCRTLGWKCHALSTTVVELSGRTGEVNEHQSIMAKVIDWLVITPERNGCATLRLPSCPCCQ